MDTPISETLLLRPVALSAERFRPYGDVIEPRPGARVGMNDARFDRFNDLAAVDIGADSGGRTCIGIARCNRATSLPYRITMVERHALGSQAFVPMGEFRFVVVVGPPGESTASADLRAFITSPGQGVNYRPGVWHMPLIALEPGQAFLVIDRGGGQAADNCEERLLDSAVTLLGE